MSSRSDDLLAKKARLAELRRQRELRPEYEVPGRQSLGGATTASPGKTTEDRRLEIDNLLTSLLLKDPSSASPSRKPSRPSSTNGPGVTTAQDASEPSRPSMQSASTQTLAMGAMSTTFEEPPSPTPAPPRREYITYTKGVQTDPFSEAAPEAKDLDGETDLRGRKRNSKRQLEYEEIRASLRKEIEEEMQAIQSGTSTDQFPAAAQQRFPLRPLKPNELNAVTGSTDFLSFVERSSKVIERALDEEYDLLADYTRSSTLQDSDDENPYSRTGKKARSLREIVQLHSERTRHRMISDIQFSPHFSELLLTSYTKNPSAPNEPAGMVLLWNTRSPSRPEYTFTAASDVLTARFSPFHPNLVIGGCYSGQICLWDTRVSGRTGVPVQKTPLSGSHLGHAHPVYNLSIIGTPNAHNILTASTDGVVCSWSVDMLTQPQEFLELSTPPPAKTDDLAPMTLSFPTSDPTFFLVGTEEGSIYPCHRYDRAGAKAGVDSRLAYRGHSAPVMSTAFHPARGPVDLGDLLLSSSSDWSIKLWRVRPAATSNTAAAATAASLSGSFTSGNAPQAIGPVLDVAREDLVYDAKWAPHKPSVFACVTGAGEVEVFDLSYDIEVPVVKAAPSHGKVGMLFKGLNKCAWEERKGASIAVGGLDGVVTVFEVGMGLSGGAGEASTDEWLEMKRLVSRLETGKF